MIFHTKQTVYPTSCCSYNESTLPHRALRTDRQFGSEVTNKCLPKAETLQNSDRQMCIVQQHLVFLAVKYVLSILFLQDHGYNYSYVGNAFKKKYFNL